MHKHVAILMRTRNRSIFLKRALESVISQSFSDWYLVLVNDGGDREELERLVHPYRDRLNGRFALLDHRKTPETSIGAPLNLGICSSESDLIAVHDDDDSWNPRFLGRCVEALADSAYAACVTQAYLVVEQIENGDLRETGREIYHSWQRSLSLFRMAESNTFAPISLVFRRSVLAKIGGRRDDLGPLEDWEFNLRLLTNYPVAFLNEPLANYHQRLPDSANGTAANFFHSHSDGYGYLDTKIRNELLRNDLIAGKAGLGLLVSLSGAHGQLFRKLRVGR